MLHGAAGTDDICLAGFQNCYEPAITMCLSILLFFFERDYWDDLISFSLVCGEKLFVS